MPKQTKKKTRKTSSKKTASKKRSVKKSAKKTAEKLAVTESSAVKSKGEGDIKEASIAQFMRKRTQLVGFDYGLYKHTQYAVEFVDNALDAIEKFQWDQKTKLNLLQNSMDRANFEFRMYDRDLQTVQQLVEEDAPKKNLVNRLNQVLSKSEDLFEKLGNIEDEVEKNIGVSGLSKKRKSISSLKDSLINLDINPSNFDEQYAQFSKLYRKIKTSQEELSNRIENLSSDPHFMYTLDKDMSLEDFSYLASNGEETTDQLDESDKESLRNYLSEGNNSQEVLGNSETSNQNENPSSTLESISDDKNDSENTIETPQSTIEELKKHVEIEEQVDDEEARELRKKKKVKAEKDKAVQELIDNINSFIQPIVNIVNNEPFVVLKMSESEAPEVYREKGGKEAFLYKFEIFDNGTGMNPDDLLRYGKYLASSKSQKLRQTRGSQGFGSPSAFSDAQNTTGRPVTVVSKHATYPYGIASEFYTTGKNTKVYVIEPERIPCKFLHGSYIKLEYLNKKYIRGYVDTYVENTAMMNSHISILYIDPYGEEHLFPRRVQHFPKEPKYALPHPSSIKIGDFQDLLRTSNNLSVTAFLADNFVRMSSSLAKQIVDEAEFEIEDQLKYLNLENGFLSKIDKEDEKWYFAKEEERIFGRSNKPRPKIVCYDIAEDDIRAALWEDMKKYNYAYKERSSLQNKIRNLEKQILQLEAKLDKSEHKKDDKKLIKDKEKEIKKLEKDIISEIKYMEDAKKALNKIVKSSTFTHEITETKIEDKIIEIVNELMISKTRPSALTRLQIEHLYMSFKNQKYMAPPTDTAIPVGESALETAVIKQFGLNITDRVDYFADPEEQVFNLNREGTLEEDELKSKVQKILSKFNDENYLLKDYKINHLKDFKQMTEGFEYDKFIEELDLHNTAGDDFIAAHTRKPTSGKGLAFVVEAVMAYSPRIKPRNKAAQVVTRYVNRTPKLRDNSDCALWLGIQSVNWKNYKVSDTFDNGIPKGNYVIYINCSGPYTHLMFKSQSKNALAEDEVLLKEVKQCMEEIGRQLRRYLSKKETREQRKKRSELIEKNIPLFVRSMHSLLELIPKYKGKITKSLLEENIRKALEADTENRKRGAPTHRIQVSQEAQALIDDSDDTSEEESEEDEEREEELEEEDETYGKDEDEEMDENSDAKSTKKPESSVTKTEKPRTAKQTLKPKSKKRTTKKTAASHPPSNASTYALTTENVLKALDDHKWHSNNDLIKILKITDIQDFKYLFEILKDLYNEKKILLGKNKEGKKVWKKKEE